MLKNFWYPCEFSSAVKNNPKQVTIFNHKFVLYRNSNREIIALNDQCPHRGASLSLGWIEEGCLRCPYHGWKFKEDGKCVQIPANQAETSIPRKASVKNYPVQEKYGFIWLLYGKLPEEEYPPLPTLPSYIFSNLRPIHYEYIEKANYARIMEANIDFSHVIAVHKRSFGQRIPVNKTIKYNVSSDDRSGFARVDYSSLEKSKSWLNLLLGFRPQMISKLSFFLPNFTLSEISIGKGNWFDLKFVILIAHIPISDTQTMIKRVFYRNFLTFPWLDNFFRKLDYKLAEEDGVVISSLSSQSIPKISEEIHVASDALGLTYRKLLEKYSALDCIMDQERNERLNPHKNSV